ncbi:MAG: hypothetical protein ABI433_00355 [Burkholderiaceae bacterium]
MQSLIVAVLVGACSVYALWTLMPAGARRSLAIVMLRAPHLPRRVEARLRKSAQAASGCGCDGCDRSENKPAAKAPAQQTITFHPRTRR